MKHLTLAVTVGFVLTVSGVQAQQFSDWSKPVSVGPLINDPTACDFGAAISKNGLSLYFVSSRPGGFGAADLYVSQRASADDPWGIPINLGPNINTSSGENGPVLSPDGHRLYFNSPRPGGFGSQDLYVSRRHNKRDDFAWQPAENLGAPVNTAGEERLPEVFEDDVTGVITLYFADAADIYASVLQPDETWGSPELVEEINSSSNDSTLTIRRDGLEMILTSNRPGTLGFNDLWVSTRAATTDPWGTPVNLGRPVNTSEWLEAHPALSFDGTELYFQRDCDILVSTRTKIGD